MGSSSKKKSSKKKSAKISSQPKKMKEARRNANKKRGHRRDSRSEDSLSPRSASLSSGDSVSDADSMSSVSMSSSSSEGTYRSRKKGSRMRKNAKIKASRKSKIREDLSRGLKRKRSKKKELDSKSRKKYRKRKKPRRHASVSSASNDSSSCSTCRSSSPGEESDHKRHRIKSTEKQKGRSESKTEIILCEERIHGLPNGSMDSRSRDQSCRVSQDEEGFVGESKSRRLRSVITVAVKPHDKEEIQLEKDLLIEEAMHDYNNIPSSKAIDARGSRSKRDVPPHPASSHDKRIESSSEEGNFLIDQKLNESPVYRKENTVQNSQNPFPDEPKNGFEKDTGDRFLADASPGENDLETILRRKALENLKKFRVKRETNVKTKANEVESDDLDANQVSVAKDVAVREGLHELSSSNVSGRAVIVNSMKSRSKKDSRRPAMPGKKTSDGEHTDKKSDAVNLNTIVATDAPTLPGNLINDQCPSQAFDPDSGSGNLSHKGKTSGMEPVSNQKATVLSSDKEASVRISETNAADKTNYSTLPLRTDDPRKRTRDVGTPGSDSGELSSGVQRTSVGQSSNDQKNEAKDGSEWKQKKMSVMRGGEMVEVSYKVYIPQRTPALARRQLKR